MSEKKSTIDSDEIDLSKVFLRIQNFFLNIQKGILNINSVIKKRKYFLLGFLVFGIIIGIIYSNKAKPVYTSGMVITSNFLDNDYCYELINTLSNSARDNSSILADKLEMSPEQANQICDIEFKDFNNKTFKIYKDSLKIHTPFKVEAKVFNVNILDSLQIKLVSYLENNSYSVKRKNIKKENLELMLNQVKNERAQLDSLKTIINQSIIQPTKGVNNNTIFMGDPIDPIKTHTEALKLYERELNIDKELSLLNNIEVVEGFTKFSTPTSPVLIVDLITFGLISFLLGLLIALRLEKKES